MKKFFQILLALSLATYLHADVVECECNDPNGSLERDHYTWFSDSSGDCCNTGLGEKHEQVWNGSSWTTIQTIYVNISEAHTACMPECSE